MYSLNRFFGCETPSSSSAGSETAPAGPAGGAGARESESSATGGPMTSLNMRTDDATGIVLRTAMTTPAAKTCGTRDFVGENIVCRAAASTAEMWIAATFEKICEQEEKPNLVP